MKAHELDVSEIITAMLSPEHLPERADGTPESPAQRLAVQDAVAKIIRENGVLFSCIACDAELKASEASACVCGGFVCPSCRRLEEEGVCLHEKPSFVHDEDWNGPR